MSGAPGPGFEFQLVPLRSGASHLCHPKSRDNHSSYPSGVFGSLWTELYSEASKKCARPTRAATRLASETGLTKCLLETAVHSAVSAENRRHS